jgi:chromosome segregation ATPase
MNAKQIMAWNRGRAVPAFVFTTLALLTALPASAQSIEDRLREQLRATVVQLRQVQDDQAALQAQKTAAEQERDALKAQLAAAKAQLAHIPKVSAPSPELEAELAKYKDAYVQATGSAQQAQASHDKLQTDLAASQNLVSACEAKNTQLMKVGNEILDAYQHFDFGDAVGANEPFIGIKRVELENLAQDYGDRLYDGKFDPHAVRPPAPAIQSTKTNP